MTAYLILGGFLLGTLVMGLWAGKDIKTMKDYVLAGRSLNTAVLTMTLVATFFSGVDFTAHPMRVFSSGILGPVALFTFFTLSFILLGVFVAPKMVYFNDCLTVGDLMRKLYGDWVGLVAGVTSTMVSMFIISAQSYIIFHINESLLRLPNVVILSIILLLVLYTTLGGMRAVAHTDVLQLIVGTLMLIGFTSVLIYHIGGVKALFQQIPAERVIDYSHTSWWEVMRSALFVGGTFTAVCTPPIVTRMLMPAKKDQAQNMFFVGSFIYCMLVSIIILMTLATVVYCQGSGDMFEQEVLAARHLMGHMARVLFADNQLAQVLMFVGMLFVILSTMDSFLQAAGIALVHDVIRPLWYARKKTAIDEVKWSKGAILFIGAIAVFNSFLYMNSNYYTAGDHQPVFYHLSKLVYSSVVLPMLIGVLGLKTDKRSFWTFFVVFVTGTTMGKFFTSLHEYTVSLLSLSCAIVMFFVSHVLINHGVRRVSRTSYSAGVSSYRFSWHGFVKWLGGVGSRVGSLPQVASHKVYSYGKESMLFAVFYLGASLVLLITNPSVLATSFLSFVVYGIGLTLSVGLLCEVLWPAFLKPYFDLYWFVTLLYCVPFVNTLLFLTNPASFTSIIGIAVALILLIVCVDWQTFLFLSSVGITIATVVYRVFSGHYIPVLDFDSSWGLAITLVLILVVGLLFARRKELYSMDQLKKSKLLAGSIAHETNNYLGTSLFAGQRINKALHSGQIKFSKVENTYSIPAALYEDLSFLGPELEQGAHQSLSKINMFMSALKENILSAKRELTSIKACIKEALKDTYFQDAEVKKGLLLEIDDDFEARLSRSYFRHIVYNIVKNAFHHGGASQVKISLDKAERKLVIRDNGKGISADRLPYIFDLFYSGGGSSGIGLALVKVIVESFGAKVHVESKQGEGSFTAFSITFAKKM